ncbi:CaiB/BaiF CoA transferase family protein [Chloroflexota bacterium]
MKTEGISLLGHLRVLDLTDDKGQLCGKILGDLGADVILIEKPGGSLARTRGPFFHDEIDPEKNLRWFANNTSKRGITLNLESVQGKRIFKKLVKTADFIIESATPGYMDSIGLGYSSLSALDSGIIMCSITPFGQSGPYAKYEATDLVANAMGGLMYICGDPDRAPLRISQEQAYSMAGVQAAAAAMIAFHYRQMSGDGQHIDVSLQASMVQTLMQPMPTWSLLHHVQKREGTKTPRAHITLGVVFGCKDGYLSWRIFPGSNGNRTRALIDWMSEEGMADDLDQVNWEETDYRTMTQEQVDHWEEVICKFFLKHTKQELHEGAVKRGIFIFPVSSVGDLVSNEQLKARNFWISLDHPELETALTYPGAPYILSETPWKMSHRAPLIGEHNEEIYLDELKLTRDKYDLLKTNGVI